MTLVEAAAHIGGPVLARTTQGRTAEGEIVTVDEQQQRVKLRLRRQRMPYTFLPRTEWWHPAHLHVPQWWLDRQAKEAS